MSVLLPQRFNTAVECVLNILLQNPNNSIAGSLIGGSVGQGTSHNDSDLDLFIVTTGSISERRRLKAAGISVDIFLNPYEELSSLLSRGPNPVLIENYAKGLPYWDPHGLVHQLQSISSARFSKGPESLSNAERITMGARNRDTLEALQLAIVAGRNDSTAYLAAKLVSDCVGAFYRTNRRWDPPPKRRMQDLSQNAPLFYGLVLEVLNLHDGDLTARIGAARSLVEQVFGHEVWSDVWCFGSYDDRVSIPVRES